MIQRENEMKPFVVNADGANDQLFDLSILQEMDDKDYIVEIVSMFLNDTPKELKAIRESLGSGDVEAVYKKAHKLKSSAGILQAEKLVDLLSEMERTAKSDNATDRLEQLFTTTQQQYKNLEVALQKLLRNM